MKTLIFLFALTAASIVQAQATEGSSVSAVVKNINQSGGKVHFALYTEDNFMKKPTLAQSSEVKNGVAAVKFENVPAGKYAVICFHDVNNNDQMDFEATGIPKENYGVSNNVMSFGPPLWNDAVFDVAGEPVEVEIKF